MPRKYFVPPAKPESKRKVTSEPTRGGAKYFVAPVPKPVECEPDEWNGTGDDLPPGYAGGEACPDCSAFRYSRHSELCPRSPVAPYGKIARRKLLTTRQIFFGVGHPIVADADSYMTTARQQLIAKADRLVLYGEVEGYRGKHHIAPSVENRLVVAQWIKENSK